MLTLLEPLSKDQIMKMDWQSYDMVVPIKVDEHEDVELENLKATQKDMAFSLTVRIWYVYLRLHFIFFHFLILLTLI